jgi:hypothetical protein
MVGPVVAAGGTPIFDHGAPLASAHRPGEPPVDTARFLCLVETRSWEDSGNGLLRYGVGGQGAWPAGACGPSSILLGAC